MANQQQNSGTPSPSSESGDPGNGPEVMGTAGTRPAGPWLLPLLLCTVLVGILLFSQPWVKWGQPDGGSSEELGARGEGVAADSTATQGGWVPAPRPVGKTVALSIDFGNGATREFTALPWRDGMMVADLMDAARHFRPSINYTQKGTQAQAFLTALEGVSQQASSDNYWFYEINGKRGIRSFGIQPLLPGDRVLWKFGPQE